MKYSHKVTFSIFAILFFGTASLAYAAGGDFIFDFDGTDGGGTAITNPSSVAVDSNDRIIVVDNTLDLVQIFDSTGSFLSDFDGTDGGGTAFDVPVSVFVDLMTE